MKNRWFLYGWLSACLSLLISSALTLGADPPSERSYASRPVARGEFQVINLPVRMVNGLILIEAGVDGEYGYFILDTGAPGLVLNRTYFRNYRKKAGVSGGGLAFAGNDVFSTYVDRLDIDQMYFENVEAGISNLGNVENTVGTKILGLLGLDLFLDFELVLDVRSNFVQIRKPSESEFPANLLITSDPPDLVIPFYLVKGTSSTMVSISSNKLSFVMDTGAQTNVLNTRLPRKVFDQVRLKQRIMINGTDGGKVEAFSAIMTECNIGDLPFYGMRAVVVNLSQMSEAYGMSIDGMLGFDFFNRGVVYINFPKKELRMNIYGNFSRNEN